MNELKINTNGFKVKEKVKLKSNTTYPPSLSNPKSGTKYECLGNIIENDGIFIKVKWQSGYKNIYKYSDLEPYNSKYKSIW